MNTVFISYRRETAAGEARALFNDLVTHLGRGSVFMDVDSIGLGRDFRAALQKTLAACDLMLVIIDKDWADVKDRGGRIRLSNPSDFVRLEIETALKRDIIVTPVLVQGALMPSAETLPIEISDLAYRNAFEISHSRWESDVREMIKRLGLDVSDGARQIEVVDQPTLSTDATRQAAKQTHWWIGGLVSAFVIAALGSWLVLSWGIQDQKPVELVNSVELVKPVAIKNILSFRDWEGSWDLEWEFEGQWYGKPLKLSADRLGISGDYVLGTLKGSFVGSDFSKVTGEITNVTGTGTTCHSGKQEGTFSLTLSNNGKSMDGWWDVCGEGKKYKWKSDKRSAS